MSAEKLQRVLFAIGGNSLILDDQHVSVEDQLSALRDTAVQIAAVIHDGHKTVITHGNGPQVGFILQRSEIAFETAHMHLVPLPSCNADTQGAIGYGLQQTLDNEFRKNGMDNQAITVVTQVVVDENDPALLKPDKPIGKFYREEEYRNLSVSHPDWKLMEDAGRGYRRVVPSPQPREIVELSAIKSLFDQGFTVIAAGGGGIPVVRRQNELFGIDAVVDKDRASALLAIEMNIDVMVISTGVPNISLNFKKDDQQDLQEVNLAQLKNYLAQGQFAPGSMAPKIEAAIKFLENGGKKVIITDPRHLAEAFKGNAGTHILP